VTAYEAAPATRADHEQPKHGDAVGAEASSVEARIIRAVIGGNPSTGSPKPFAGPMTRVLAGMLVTRPHFRSVGAEHHLAAEHQQNRVRVVSRGDDNEGCCEVQRLWNQRIWLR